MENSIQYFDVNDIIVRFENNICDMKGKIAALKSIHRLHKKNGDDFAILSKNFDNCTFGGLYACDDVMKLKFYYANTTNIWNEDWITITLNEKDMTDEQKASHTIANYDWHNNPLNYYMNADEIENAIASAITTYENNIKGYEDAIKMIKDGKCDIINHVIELSKEYNELSKNHNSLNDKDHTALYHIYYALFNYFN